MKNKRYIKAKYTCLLAFVFVCPQFMSPLHFVFVHHDQVHAHESKIPMFSVHEKECAYCDFHFFHFINETELHKDIAFVRHTFNKKADNLIHIWLDSAINESILGRAPPFNY